jgi:hypothetical protein
MPSSRPAAWRSRSATWWGTTTRSRGSQCRNRRSCDGPNSSFFPHRWDHIYFPNWDEFQRHALRFGVTDFDVGLRFLREDAPAGLPSCVVAEELGAAEPFEAESCESPLIEEIEDYTA